MIEGKIEGLDEQIEAAKKSGKFDYDATIPGHDGARQVHAALQAQAVDYLFPYTLAHVPFGAMAREVVEAYGDDVQAHPVGTGPYMLKEWRRAAKIVLEANPEYRGYDVGFPAGRQTAWDQAVVTAMKGKKIPQIGRVEISIIEEEPVALARVQRKELDLLALPATFRQEVLDAEQAEAGVDRAGRDAVSRDRPRASPTPSSISAIRSSADSRRKRSRCAARSSWGTTCEEEIRVDRARIRRSQAQMPIPFGVVGFDPSYRSINQYDPVLANKLLDYFGYKQGRRRLSHAARRQAAGDPPGDRHRSHRPRIQRAVEEVDGRDRHPDGVQRRASSPIT